MPLAVVAPVVGTAAPPVAPAPIASAAAAAAAALAAARRPLAPMDTNSAASLARIVAAVQDVEKSTTKRKADGQPDVPPQSKRVLPISSPQVKSNL